VGDVRAGKAQERPLPEIQNTGPPDENQRFDAMNKKMGQLHLLRFAIR
jgi:hypothetical protein